MLKINKKIEYALIVLKFIAEKKESNDLTTTREVCDQFKTPFDTTAKVMQMMNSNNILTSVKGIKGGYALKADLGELSYYDLAKVIQVKEESDYCISNNKVCELFETCNISSPLNQFSNNINKYLKNLSIKDLLWSNHQ